MRDIRVGMLRAYRNHRLRSKTKGGGNVSLREATQRIDSFSENQDGFHHFFAPEIAIFKMLGTTSISEGKRLFNSICYGALITFPRTTILPAA